MKYLDAKFTIGQPAKSTACEACVYGAEIHAPFCGKLPCRGVGAFSGGTWEVVERYGVDPGKIERKYRFSEPVGYVKEQR